VLVFKGGSRECFLEVNIDNRSKIIIVYEDKNEDEISKCFKLEPVRMGEENLLPVEDRSVGYHSLLVGFGKQRLLGPML
jgi:hypothetical protein